MHKCFNFGARVETRLGHEPQISKVLEVGVRFKEENFATLEHNYDQILRKADEGPNFCLVVEMVNLLVICFVFEDFEVVYV